MAPEPTTLQEAVLYAASPDNCREYLVARRWPNGVICPTCGSDKVKFQPQHNRWQCSNRHPRRQFTLKTGTVMEDSPLGLDKWLMAMWLVASNRNGISSWELHRAIGITQKSAWFLLHRIRLAMQDENFGGKLGGEVECDETFIGGKARNMHKDVKARRIHSRGGDGKAIVTAVLQRGGKVRASVVPDRREHTIQDHVRKHVEAGSNLYTDELQSYEGLGGEYMHEVINDAEAYVRENVHTNNC